MTRPKNKKSKLLFLGGSSLLFSIWSKEINKQYEIFITKNIQKVDSFKYRVLNIDFSYVDKIAKKLDEYNIEIVVNAIGLTSVEKCESDPSNAFKINTYLAGKVAKACAISGTKFIHISTDHFFNDENKLHSEEDSVSLLNTYAKSKFEGEIQVLSNLPNALVCRTNFFGRGPTHKLSFSDWIIKSAKNGQLITLHNDVFITPVHGESLARITYELVEKKISGIYNISSDESISKYDFGIALCKFLNLPNKFINSGSIHDRTDLVKRPTSMALSNKKLLKTLDFHIGSVSNQFNYL